MCDVSDPRILNAYYSITDYEPTNCGTNGLSEFRDNLTNEILFGFVRIEDKFVLITYVPDSVNGVRRAKALVHSRSVAQICELSHAQITASSLSDLSDSNLRTRLKLGEKQVPNRSRPTAKRSSVVSRRRSSNLSPSPSPTPPPIMTFPKKRTSLIINTGMTEEPDNNLYIPSTPTSVTSFSDTTTVVDCNSSVSSSKDYYERIKAEEAEENSLSATELLFQTQLLRKRELEEARFKQTIREQQDEKERREQQIKKIEEEEKKIRMDLQLKQRQLAEEREKISWINKRQSKTFDVLRPTSPSLKSKTSNTSLSSTTMSRSSTISQLIEDPKPIILMSGFISVQTRNSPFWKRRYYVVESTKKVLLYKDEISMKTPISTINLPSVTRLAPANEDEDIFVPNSFIIDTPTDSYQLLADDKKTGKKILATLQEIVA
ncbi:hypothetical protein G6F57_005148 [Rhizopus arrhizus]|uniref:PH domain-containing protein n=1 Tax=Rhizopus oryzae TaxID=64495 RepID=A0A9P7BT57_RHIOR|nr:hypothetical protein G6F24_005337 [Rhizopus arrhizus]KAG1425264.1 hypothetical protein G6F58_002012 [Rhizopus delemar]KAG0790799.1 hypothetical protein G6F21_005549 [Rhizopus arrhizus]KAG0798387.1 hypothetical protein G6F22_004275 [Rhizopus arrhizus]KAG0812239.1 hypothetical protein G6F20_006528 [Rhizopus arrhizus]